LQDEGYVVLLISALSADLDEIGNDKRQHALNDLQGVLLV
jgi:hypothetical protein